ncbi:MAG: hypothetical protein HQL91_04720 [Magnetococcales bacterium]|nr:hypothetical protein [Magnetococcales bacterium]
MDMSAFSEPFSREMPHPLTEVVPLVSSHDDLAAVLEEIAEWLAQTLPVEMIAYWNPRLRKSHLLCLAPLNEREELTGVVRELVHGAVPRIRHWRQRQWFFHLWMGTPLDGWDRLLIVERSGKLSSEECNLLIQEAARTFRNALRHADHPVGADCRSSSLAC